MLLALTDHKKEKGKNEGCSGGKGCITAKAIKARKRIIKIRHTKAGR